MLAAIHFNENSGKPQLETKDGEKRWRVSYLKYKNSGVVKPIKSKSTYSKWSNFTLNLVMNTAMLSCR